MLVLFKVCGLQTAACQQGRQKGTEETSDWAQGGRRAPADTHDRTGDRPAEPCGGPRKRPGRRSQTRQGSEAAGRPSTDPPRRRGALGRTM